MEFKFTFLLQLMGQKEIQISEEIEKLRQGREAPSRVTPVLWVKSKLKSNDGLAPLLN